MTTLITSKVKWSDFLICIVVIFQNTNLLEAFQFFNCFGLRGSVLDRGTRCGYVPYETPVPYIMGGSDADLGEFPWMARVFHVHNDPEVKDYIYVVCGGSIIHESYILTAAHCCEIRDHPIHLSFVRVGEYDTSKKEDCRQGRCAPTHRDLDIEYYKNHPQYNHTTLKNDICLIKLKEPMRFTRYALPICLPLTCDKRVTGYEGGTFVAAGWGNVAELGNSEILQKVHLPSSPIDVCQRSWGWVDGATHICAGSDPGKDVCGGDSGAPLMITSRDNGPKRYFQVGIVSFGNKCNSSNKEPTPGVYTRVSYYIPWIISNMK